MSDQHDRVERDPEYPRERTVWDEPSPGRVDRGYDFDPTDPFIRRPDETPPASIPKPQEPTPAET
jgi:hypothetical protein